MTTLKSVLLLLLMSFYVPVSCQDPCRKIKSGKVPHPTVCKKFYECTYFKGKEHTCPSDEHFSLQDKGCIPKEQSDCVTKSAPVTTKKAAAAAAALPGRKPGSVLKCYPNQANQDLFNKYFHSGKTYFLSKAIYISDVASAAMCKTLCGYLAEIADQGEFDFVVSLTAKHNYYGILVAGTDKYTEGKWEYDRTVESVTYFNWCLDPKEPNNYNDQDCMGVSKRYSCMFDHQCVHEHNYYSFRYLCEVDKTTD